MNRKKALLVLIMSCCLITNNTTGKTASFPSSQKSKSIEMQHESHHISSERDDSFNEIRAYYDFQGKVIRICSYNNYSGETYLVDRRNYVVAYLNSCYGELDVSPLKHGEYRLCVVVNNDTYYGTISI